MPDIPVGDAPHQQLPPPEPMPVVAQPVAPAATWPPPGQYAPPQYAPQQYSLPQQYAPAPKPPRRPMRTRVLVMIVVGSVLLLSGIVLGTSLLVRAASTAIDDLGTAVAEQSGLGPLAEGAPGSPHATTPLECAEVCFTADVTEQLVTGASEFTALGLPVLVSGWGAYDVTTPADEWYYSAESWNDEGGSPDECFFAYSGPPIANGLQDPPPESTEAVDYIAQYSSEDEYNGVTQVVRVFGSSAEAVAHMEATTSNIAGCRRYSYSVDSDYTGGVVAAEPALVVPDSVAALGWSESNLFGRYYVFDLQRANLVIRSTVYTDGTVDELDYRAMQERLAGTLASIPLPG